MNEENLRHPAVKRVSRFMLILFWLAAMFLATRWFAHVENAQHNPNAEISSKHVQQDGHEVVEVQLKSNGSGHYLSIGEINRQPVEFLLDTGATYVAIPDGLARDLKLERGDRLSLNTANGLSSGYTTHLTELRLGDIVLRDVSAVIVPAMTDDEVLLGMSALRQLDFSQRDGSLLLRQTLPR